MTATLVIADATSGPLDEQTAELLSAASELNAPIVLGLMAADPGAVSNIHYPGISQVLGIRIDARHPNHELRQRAVEALIEKAQPGVVLLPLSWDNCAFASGLAERHDLSFVSDVVGLSSEPDGTISASRQLYSGKVCASLSLSTERPAILLIRPGTWPAAEASGEPVALELCENVVQNDTRVRVVEVIESPPDDDALGTADIVFGLGRGVGKAEQITVFAELAEQMGAALGASRPLVDVGLLPRNKQIGQSGVSVSPKLYVAFGVSGALQHMEGITRSKVIFAVNTDQQAPIFNAAHWGATVDAMEVARCLLAGE